ncbi:sensor histidine kinase [Massilia consociata]|uniref:histidine kinase n=1 Tax=Massilia consociata TaxID=760117 RepID=A0ABV6FGM2_9BURK
MTFASDQPSSTSGLSPTSRRMLALREAVFQEWEARVRASLQPAQALSRPILVDTLPAFYDNIAQSLSADYPRASAVDGTTLAAEHGGERARITAYDHEALIGEYQVFRWAIFEVLQREGVALCAQEILAINASIDAGIKEAVAAFVLVHGALRERFAAALTHDLRGPLGATSTALELIMMSNDPEKMKAFAATALDNVHRMNAMIHELLATMAFHSGEQLSLELSHFDILELVQEVRRDAIALHGPRVRIAGQSVFGWWDRHAMKRALENIVGNAIQYGREGTSVTVSSKEVSERLLLAVHNEGEPIAPEEQETVFEMYRRAQASKLKRKQGWGIGLPYVRAVAESHGGSIALDSTAERGTTFAIDVPKDCRPSKGAPTLA